MYKILAVDDDQFFLSMVSSYYEGADFHICTADSYKEGLRMFQEETFDCILLDILLPDGDGFELCREIRSKSDVPIIFLTNKEEEADRIKGFEYDCDDYVCKPCSFEELAHRMRKRISGKAANGIRQCLVYNGLEINLDTKIASYERKTLPLTTMEYDVLAFLALHPGETFSKYDIYHQVWNQVHLNDIHTVQVHIASLRKKLNLACRDREYILTVWGKGYQFVGKQF